MKLISAFSYRSIKNWSATTTVEEQKKNKQLKVNEGKLPVNEGFGERDKLVLQQVMSFRKRIVKACCGLQWLSDRLLAYVTVWKAALWRLSDRSISYTFVVGKLSDWVWVFLIVWINFVQYSRVSMHVIYWIKFFYISYTIPERLCTNKATVIIMSFVLTMFQRELFFFLHTVLLKCKVQYLL